MQFELPLQLMGNIIGYSGVEITANGINFYGVRGLMSGPVLSNGFAFDDIADIECEINRFAPDNLMIVFKDQYRLPFMFQTHKDAGPTIARVVKQLLAQRKS